MTSSKIPLYIDEINESIYGGFWLRLGSLLLDGLIMMPYGLLLIFLNGISVNVYYYTFIPSIAIHFWYNIYLVKKNGGTPGKVIAGIKILKMDGTDVTWKEAIVRQIISFSLPVFLSVSILYALSSADDSYYISLGWRQKQEYIYSLIPINTSFYTIVSNVWILSELLVLLFNNRRRALHDFMAGTVIVKTKYINKIRATILLNDNNS